MGSRDDVNTGMTFFVRQLEATNTGLPLEFYSFSSRRSGNLTSIISQR